MLGQTDRSEYVERRLEQALATADLSPADRHLCQELTYGVIRWQATLDWLIARKTAGRQQKPMLQNLLRLGLYQIFWLDRIPAHAAVHETVELARHNGFGPQSGFVNAVLRGYLRELDPTRQALRELRVAQPAVGYSHPAWLVERWQRRFGIESTAQLLAWNNTPPETFARVNTLKIDAGELVTQWRDENVGYDFVRRDWLEENLVFVLKSHPPFSRVPSFQQGCFYVQDPSTLLAVRELAPEPSDRVLDLCAAPGGKLTYIAQLMRNKGLLVAHDVEPNRMKQVQENCARLGITCVVPAQPETLAAASAALYDRVLIDAPCSNTGVLRRRVDLRWRLQAQEIPRLSATQRQLLDQAAPLVRPGGTVVYSTCSLEPEENGEVVADFLRRSPQFRLDRERELRPFADGVDGGYVARLTRTL